MCKSKDACPEWNRERVLWYVSSLLAISGHLMEKSEQTVGNILKGGENMQSIKKTYFNCNHWIPKGGLSLPMAHTFGGCLSNPTRLIGGFNPRVENIVDVAFAFALRSNKVQRTFNLHSAYPFGVTKTAQE